MEADDEILRHCEEHGDIGLLVMGSRGPHWPHKSADSWGASQNVVRHAHCPVLVARSWGCSGIQVANFLAEAQRRRIW